MVPRRGLGCHSRNHLILQGQCTRVYDFVYGFCDLFVNIVLNETNKGSL